MIRSVLICFSCIKPVIAHNLPLLILCTVAAHGMCMCCKQYGMCNIWVWNGTGLRTLFSGKECRCTYKARTPWLSLSTGRTKPRSCCGAFTAEPWRIRQRSRRS